jgi:hypothetical protein
VGGIGQDSPGAAGAARAAPYSLHTSRAAGEKNAALILSVAAPRPAGGSWVEMRPPHRSSARRWAAMTARNVFRLRRGAPPRACRWWRWARTLRKKREEPEPSPEAIESELRTWGAGASIATQAHPKARVGLRARTSLPDGSTYAQRSLEAVTVTVHRIGGGPPVELEERVPGTRRRPSTAGRGPSPLQTLPRTGHWLCHHRQGRPRGCGTRAADNLVQIGSPAQPAPQAFSGDGRRLRRRRSGCKAVARLAGGIRGPGGAKWRMRKVGCATRWRWTLPGRRLATCCASPATVPKCCVRCYHTARIWAVEDTGGGPSTCSGMPPTASRYSRLSRPTAGTPRHGRAGRHRGTLGTRSTGHRLPDGLKAPSRSRSALGHLPGTAGRSVWLAQERSIGALGCFQAARGDDSTQSANAWNCIL